MTNDPQIQPGIAFPINPTSQSVVNDQLENNFINLLWNNIFYYKTVFEAIDGSLLTCNAGSGATCSSSGIAGQLVLNTQSASTGQYADIDKRPLYISGLSWQRPSRMRVGFQVSAITGQTIYLIRGSQNVVSPYYGFKVVNATLYGVFYAGTGSEKLVTLQPIVASSVSGTPPADITNSYVCEAQYQYGDAIKFVVNGNYKGMIRVNTAPIAPTAAISSFYNFHLTTNENVGKSLGISFFEYIQEK